MVTLEFLTYDIRSEVESNDDVDNKEYRSGSTFSVGLHHYVWIAELTENGKQL